MGKDDEGGDSRTCMMLGNQGDHWFEPPRGLGHPEGALGEFGADSDEVTGVLQE